MTETPGIPSHLGRLIDSETGYALVCSWEGSGGPLCGEQATGHAIWTDDAENSLCCRTHVPAARALDPLEVHTTENGACGMPGSIWLKDEHRCVMDLTETEPALPVRAAVDINRGERAHV